MWSFKLCPLILIGMTPLCLGGIFKVDIMLLLKASSVGKNDPSLCMNNCLPESQNTTGNISSECLCQIKYQFLVACHI